jgi:dipeptidyl-peptidase-4
VVFLRSGAGDDPVLKLWVLDVATGSETCLFDPLAEPGSDVELTPAERARRERKRERATGVVAYACDREVTGAVFVEGGRLHHVELASGSVVELETSGVPDDPRLSPDGSLVAYVIDGAVSVQKASGGPERVLASDDDPDVSWGLAEFAAAEELGRGQGFWWSPDGSRIAAARVDERAVERWWISDPTDPAGEPRPARYPQAGTANAVVTLHLIDVATGAAIQVTWDDPERFEYLAVVEWDESALTLQVLSRDQKEARVLEADPATGITKVVSAEIDDAWVEVVAGVPTRLGDGQLVTATVAGDARGVAIDDVVVSGPELHVHRVAGTDGDEVLVTGWAGDPLEEHVWSLSSGRDPERVTSEVGLHDVTSAGGTTVITSWLEHEDHARTVVRGGGGDHPTHEVESLAEVPVVAAAPRHLRVGPLGLPVVVCTPGGVEPGTKLPVLVSSYGGPHVNDVGRWRGQHRVSQWFADRLGAAVLTIDGRGMAGHGVAWEQAVHLDFGLTLDDQIAGLLGAADELGYLDVGRVAFRGWSFGGMLAAMAVLRRPDVFHAAVAGAPVTDQRLYDTAYTERYLGIPDEQPEAYRRSSPISYVDGAEPQRPLLLIHGLADDNVYAAHTLQLSAALFARGYQHELVLLPNASHIGGFDDLVVARYVTELDFLRRALGLEVP